MACLLLEKFLGSVILDIREKKIFYIFSEGMRDIFFLQKRLDFLLSKYFPDALAKKEDIYVKWGRVAVYRFGSIKYLFKKKAVEITVNGRFRDKKYPIQIIDHTLAHELVHFVQGFPQPGPALHRYPHRGGVIDNELKERKLSHLVNFYKKWVPHYLESL